MLHHERVHVDVGRESSTVAGVADTTVFKLFFCSPVDFHVLDHFLVGLNTLLLSDLLLYYLLHAFLVFDL